MNKDWITPLLTLIATLGGYEGVKYLINLRSQKKKEAAEANKAETDADMVEIEALEKRLKLMSDQLLEQEATIKKLRDELNKQNEAYDALRRKMLAANNSIIDLQKTILNVTETAELAKSQQCFVDDCPKRIPPKINKK